MARTVNLILVYGLAIGLAFALSDLLATAIRQALKALAW